MKNLSRLLTAYLLLFVFLFLNLSTGVFALANGDDAVELIGQPDYFTKIVGSDADSFAWPNGVSIDSVNHRMFVSDKLNHRVMVFNLDSSNQLVDAVADNILGTGASGTSINQLWDPNSTIYDSTNDWLFVSDLYNNRVMIFDVASIVDGEDAIYVLGQADFDNKLVGGGASGLYYPDSVAYDPGNDILYVADTGNNRVMLYDLGDGISNGENAVNVLGQVDFDGDWWAITPSGLKYPRGVGLDIANDRLFVVDTENNRVMVYDISANDPNCTTPNDGICDGEDAINVLGQANFTSGGSALTPSGFDYPLDVSYDSNNDRIYVADSYNSRVMIFDVASISDGDDAIYVLGQTDFISDDYATTQSGMDYIEGVHYDPIGDRIYVADSYNIRVTGFDVSVAPAAVVPEFSTYMIMVTLLIGGSAIFMNRKKLSGVVTTVINLI